MKISRSKTTHSLATAASEWQFASQPTWRLSRWTNHRAGQTMALRAGAELSVELEAARRRLWIEGWRMKAFEQPPRDAAAVVRPEFDDSGWPTTPIPSMVGWHALPRARFWARTHLFLPPDCATETLTLVLGGWGIADFRYTRVFVNGHRLGVRRTTTRWFEPGEFALGPGTALHRQLRFGQDNVITLELREPFWRPAKLERFDRQGAHTLPWPGTCTEPYQQCVVVGPPPRRVTFQTERVQARGRAELRVTLRGRQAPLRAELAYRLADDGATLVRTTRLENTGAEPVRLVRLWLGDYPLSACWETSGTGVSPVQSIATSERTGETPVPLSARAGVLRQAKTDAAARPSVTEGEMGFPVYAKDEFFFSVAHPAGWAMGERGTVRLAQYPAAQLAPGAAFAGMETRLGVAERGGGRAAFRAQLRRQMRRVVRGHDRPYAIFEFFGSWKMRPDELFMGQANVLSLELTEKFSLTMMRRLAEFQRQTRTRFDAVCFEFWCDRKGDMTRFDAKRFPRGFAPVRAALRRLGIPPALWLDSAGGGWSIGENPVVAPARADNPNYAASSEGGNLPLCRATDPFRTMFTEAFRYHLRETGARLFKFDNLRSLCYNPQHGHWPGIYSTESIYAGAIETLRALDAESPDVFLIGYWGHRSPWWLLHCDVIFECGLAMEAASPSSRPSLYARDGVAVGLDQGTRYAEDVPLLGKDSLGVWLSDWGWNSGIGKERWREGMIMDLCRGSLLLQPWSDERWLTLPERKQVADLVTVLRARPDCFAAARPVLGDPWREEVYGYACGNGRRAFLAVNNCTWQDQPVTLQLNAAWGLREGTRYAIYRLHPRPGRLAGQQREFRGAAAVWMRPFEVALFEVVPVGESPTLRRAWPTRAVRPFATASAPVRLRVHRRGRAIGLEPLLVAERKAKQLHPWPVSQFVVQGAAPASPQGGRVVLAAEFTQRGRALPFYGIGKHFAARVRQAGRPVAAEPVLAGNTFPAAWQAWRMAVPASACQRPLTLEVSICHPPGTRVAFSGHFVPAG